LRERVYKWPECGLLTRADRQWHEDLGQVVFVDLRQTIRAAREGAHLCGVGFRAEEDAHVSQMTIHPSLLDPLFPEKNLDMVVMVYVLHMIERPLPFLKNLHTYLRPGGALVIIERNAAAERAHFPAFMTKGQILDTMSETGFALDRTETFLPRDTIYIYKAKQQR
jgi:SAM-dependent methyltransferase